MSRLRPNVIAVKRRMAEAYEELNGRHRAGCGGVELCGLLTDLRDEILLDLFEAALADLARTGTGELRSEVALVAHGGYGRCDLAPHSDVDLMILHTCSVREEVVRLARRLVCDVFDAGLAFGHSVRTPAQAVDLACRDPVVATSLIESRRLGGSETLFAEFVRRFRRHVRRQAAKMITAVVSGRSQERARYGETIYLLEPNVKRSAGALRDVHLLRWIGLLRYGASEPDRLRSLDLLSEKDLQALQKASEFLLRLRNEMHFHAGKPADVLDRAEQLRIAQRFGYPATAGLLPVERFMQDYFSHTKQVSRLAARFVANARSKSRLHRWVAAVFGHQVARDLHVGPAGLVATERGLERVRGDLTAIMRTVNLANLHNQPMAPEIWEAIHREAASLPEQPPPDAYRHFLSLLDHPARLGTLLGDLHGAGLLERFVPALARTRGLLEFSQYHQYTVDEHCLRAVDFATRRLFDMGPLGRVYRRIAQKRVLHLALLIHDLGKGLAEDHCEVGLRIAQQTARRLGLSQRETETLKFLVHKHLLMNHLAFHRDTSDPQVVVRFAREVGSPELLEMLFVLTAADLAAVGPGVWDGWKAQIVTELYHRTMEQLAGDSPATTPDEALRRRRDAVRAKLGHPVAAGQPSVPRAATGHLTKPLGGRAVAGHVTEPPGGPKVSRERAGASGEIGRPAPSSRRDSWLRLQLDALPAGYLLATEPEQVASDLRLLYEMRPGGAIARGRYQPETDTVQYTIATHEETTPGVFHKLTGALASHGLEIRSAQIHTLADGLILDRFWVHDPDYPGEPPPERIEELNTALVRSLSRGGGQAPSFRRRRRVGGHRRVASCDPHTRISSDNATSDRYTILDVFTQDRLGLLYTIARTLFELGLSVWRAKIATYGDRVVDVFYVTDQQGDKIDDEDRLASVQHQLQKRIRSL